MQNEEVAHPLTSWWTGVPCESNQEVLWIPLRKHYITQIQEGFGPQIRTNWCKRRISSAIRNWMKFVTSIIKLTI